MSTDRQSFLFYSKSSTQTGGRGRGELKKGLKGRGKEIKQRCIYRGKIQQSSTFLVPQKGQLKVGALRHE